MYITIITDKGAYILLLLLIKEPIYYYITFSNNLQTCILNKQITNIVTIKSCRCMSDTNLWLTENIATTLKPHN